MSRRDRLGRHARQFLRQRSGALAAEFAFILPVFLTFVFGTVEVARYMWSDHALNYAAEQTTRFVIANPSASNGDIQAYAQSQLMTVDKNDVTVAVTNETINGIDYVNVTTSIPYEVILPLVPLDPMTLTSTTRVPTS